MLDILIPFLAQPTAIANSQISILPTWFISQSFVSQSFASQSLASQSLAHVWVNLFANRSIEPSPDPSIHSTIQPVVLASIKPMHRTVSSVLPLPVDDLPFARLSFSRTMPLAQAIARLPTQIAVTRVATAPLGWTATEISPGVIAYAPPAAEQLAVAVAPSPTEEEAIQLSETDLNRNQSIASSIFNRVFDHTLSNLTGDSAKLSSQGMPNHSSDYSSENSFNHSAYRSLDRPSHGLIFDTATSGFQTVPSIAASINAFDGTRHPYVSEIRVADLLEHEIAPGRYLWSGIWQGEGYDRWQNRFGRLVAARENGADIHIHVAYDMNIRDPKVANLRIVIESEQAETAQVTNISAFLRDSRTKEILARRDFPQLPPDYEVTLTKNNGFSGTEIQILEPLGVITFAYHITKDELRHLFPLKLQADNRQFQQRQLELFDLQTQGWDIDEVPPPS